MLWMTITILQYYTFLTYYKSSNKLLDSFVALCVMRRPEVESSRTKFEILGLEGQVLGLEASSPRKFTALFFVPMKSYRKTPETSRKSCEDLFCFPQLEIAWKKNLKIFLKNFLRPFIYLFILFYFIFWERLHLCPWSVALASSIPVLGLERVCPQKGCPWPRIFLCPWPWVLCPRLHLWRRQCVLIHVLHYIRLN